VKAILMRAVDIFCEQGVVTVDHGGNANIGKVIEAVWEGIAKENLHILCGRLDII
jgi:hypothetical protein